VVTISQWLVTLGHHLAVTIYLHVAPSSGSHNYPLAFCRRLVLLASSQHSFQGSACTKSSCLGVDPAELFGIAVDRDVFQLQRCCHREPPQKRAGTKMNETIQHLGIAGTLNVSHILPALPLFPSLLFSLCHLIARLRFLLTDSEITMKHGQGWIRPVRLEGAIPVIFEVHSHNGFATIKDMKYTSQHRCDKTTEGKMSSYRQCCFPNCTKLWWIK